MEQNRTNTGALLNAYCDSMGGTLSDIVKVLKKKEFENSFESFYILPSVFNTDLDRGFSVISYDLNEALASGEDIEELKKLNISLLMDFVLNHISVLSPQFQDILKYGDESKYRDFFIDWNRFWEGCGKMSPEGYIIPEEEYLSKMFFRKPGLPILMVRFPDNRDVPYWNTFYQEINYPDLDAYELVRDLGMQYCAAEEISEIFNSSDKDIQKVSFGRWDRYREQVLEYVKNKRTYLGQMDLNIRSPLVWEYYRDTLQKLADYGASIVRLDAFAYAPKEPGERNFLNDPGTWDLLEKIHEIAEEHQLILLPEIHASYEEKIYETLAEKGYLVYDFFLPGLIIDAFERKNGTYLKKWMDEIVEKKIRTVNMLGCHDGIPLLDLKGLLPEESIQNVIDALVKRGGYVKDLHGAKNVYYQVNAAYYSALGESDATMLMARALQLFMPGRPQVWYLDLFAGKNDYEGMRRAGAGGHKEINRTNLSMEQIEEALQKDVVKKQLEMLRLRNTSPVFSEDAEISSELNGCEMRIAWRNEWGQAELTADFEKETFSIQIDEA